MDHKFEQLLADHPFLRHAKLVTPGENNQAGKAIKLRINSGDLSDVSSTIRPIIEIGCQNGGIQFVEVDAYDKCRLHIIMKKPLAVSIDTCLEMNSSVDYFKYDNDPWSGLPVSDSFICKSTGETVSFSLDVPTRRHAQQFYISRYHIIGMLISIAVLVGVITAILLSR